MKKESVYMNLFMVTKYKQDGKMSSHNWFFNGLCNELDAQYAVMVEVGMMMEK